MVTMTQIVKRSAFGALLILVSSALPALAIPVNGPFGSDTFARAIHFTSTSKPTTTNRGPLRNIFRGTGGIDSGVVMSPVGDGSYVCTAAVFPGASLTYHFGFRNRTFEPDTHTSFETTAPGNERDQDINRARTITVPVTAANGYYIYNAYADRTVIGFQGPDSSIMNTTNSFVRTIGGTGETVGMARLNTADDTIFANMDGTNAFNVDAIQTGDSSFVLSWQFSVGGAERFVPSVQGAKQFGNSADNAKNGSAHYGFRIYRADSPTGGFVGANFVDRTAAMSNGDTNYSDNDNNAFNDQSVTDTSWPDTVTTCLYLVTFHNAYRYTQTDTTRQNFSGGYDTQVRGSAIRVFFIVEHYDENVVFPNGKNEGRVYVTPYIDGERRADLRHPAMVHRVTRGVAI